MNALQKSPGPYWDYIGRSVQSMKRESLDKLLKTLDDMGYELISIDASRIGRAKLEIGIPVYVNNRGETIDPKTGEVLPQFL
jgi:hypothetical protein